MLREIVRFNGQPVEIELAYATGKEDNKGNGAFYTYTLAGNRIMFATVALNERIQQLQPRKGDRLSICLLPDKQWTVSKLTPPAGGPGSDTGNVPPAKPQAGLQTTQQQKNSTSAQIPDAPYSHTGWAGFLRDQATSLIDVAAHCHRYAAEKYPGLLSNGDVADLVTTAFINLAKNGGTR